MTYDKSLNKLRQNGQGQTLKHLLYTTNLTRAVCRSAQYYTNSGQWIVVTPKN